MKPHEATWGSMKLHETFFEAETHEPQRSPTEPHKASRRLLKLHEGPGEISGLCNGDATSVESFKGDTMKTFNGMCVLYLGSKDADPGDIKVKVTSDGLKDGQVELKGCNCIPSLLG